MTEQRTQNNHSPTQELTGALHGIRVIDLTRVLSGPFCTQMLGDHGADVIKVEPPKKGDIVRSQGWIKNDISWYFAQFNRNKRSITVDLRSDEGKLVLKKLLEDADVLVENFRPGVLAKMGLDDDYLLENYPRLIVARINGFGSTGPYKDRPAYDFIAQAMSGFIGVNGTPESGPLRTAAPISDMIAGTNLAFGISAALVKREKTGKGDIIETALTNGLISMLAYLAAEYFATGEQPQPTGNDHPILYPYGLFKTADQDVAIAPSNDIMVNRFLSAIGLLHLLDDPRFIDNTQRMNHKDEMRALINAVLVQKTRDHWIELLNKAGVPCGRVFSLHDTFTDPQVLAQDMRLELDQKQKGKIPTTGIPVKLRQSPGAIWHNVPELGEHTMQVLLEAGFNDKQLKEFKHKGII